MDRIRVLIVDDEPPARTRLKRLLEPHTAFEVAGEAGSGPEAVEAIARLAPDVVFLDVQMPGLDGFEVVEAIADAAGQNAGGTTEKTGDAEAEMSAGAGPLPQIVFVTAYDAYAVRAFEIHAVDYLLKPFDPERFGRTLARLEERVASSRPGEERLLRQLRDAMAAARRPPGYLERILVPVGTSQRLLAVDHIDWIEAEGNQVRLHVGAESYLVRGTLTALEERLDPARFLRIHRKRIVNAARIRELHPWSHGDQLVILDDGTELRMSRRYRDRLAALEP